MNTIKNVISTQLAKKLSEFGITDIVPHIEYPADPKHGDYSSNVAMIAAKQLGRNPREVAEEIVKDLRLKIKDLGLIEKIETADPGFINFWVKDEVFLNVIARSEETNDEAISSSGGLPSQRLGSPMAARFARNDGKFAGQKIFIEYAHPNTHKEMHIGHMRTLITGEAVARMAEAAGAEVFRANYQGDIGLHVAKALYGIQKMMQEEGLELAKIAEWSHADKAHFLGKGYALGSQEYEAHKEEIDQINKDLYAKDSAVHDLYATTRQWSLDYYDEFYKRFYTQFDKLFFESEVADLGKKIVEENIGTIFAKENGAIVFKGEEFGLHTRVFITQAGNPTYEGKEMGNAVTEYKAFHFNKKIHVVGSEQAGYFAVVFKALELLDPEKFKDKQQHISMGMVQFADPTSPSASKGQVRKMSSRTGDILKVDWLIDQVKEKVREIMTDERIDPQHQDETIEQIAIGAIKYSVLQVGTGQNVSFNIEKSVSLDGNSGPYLQYVYARTQSVLRRSEKLEVRSEKNNISSLSGALAESKGSPAFDFAQAKISLEIEEREILRLLSRFPEIVEEAAVRYAPSTLATYLFALAQAYNLFYQKHQILNPSVIASKAKQSQADGIAADSSSPRSDMNKQAVRNFRLQLTQATGETLKSGLHLLGIQAPEKM